MIGVSVLAGVMIYFLAEKCGLLNGESTIILSVILSVLGLVGDAAVDVIGLVVAGCLGSGVVFVQLSDHEKEGTVILSVDVRNILDEIA